MQSACKVHRQYRAEDIMLIEQVVSVPTGSKITSRAISQPMARREIEKELWGT